MKGLCTDTPSPQKVLWEKAMKTGVDSCLCFIILAFDFFLKSEDEIYACLFKTIIEEIEPRNCHANTYTKVSEKEGVAIIFEEQRAYLPGNVIIPNAKTVWI